MKKINEDLDRLLAVFRRETLENFFTLSTVLKNENVSPKELKEYLDWKTKLAVRAKAELTRSDARKIEEARKLAAEWKKKAKKCPRCGESLSLTRVTTPRGPSNKEGWRSLWFCQTENCLFEEYSREFTDKIYTEIMED